MERNYIVTIKLPDECDGPTLGNNDVEDAIRKKATELEVPVVSVEVER